MHLIKNVIYEIILGSHSTAVKKFVSLVILKNVASTESSFTVYRGLFSERGIHFIFHSYK